MSVVFKRRFLRKWHNQNVKHTKSRGCVATTCFCLKQERHAERSEASRVLTLDY